MKRALLFIFLIGTLMSQGFSQTFSLLNPPDSLIAVDKSVAEFKVDMNIKNTSDDTIQISMLRFHNVMAATSDTAAGTYFCWDFCYGTSVDQSQSPILLYPGDTLNSVKAKGYTGGEQYVMFQPGGIDGYSEAKVRIVNFNDTNDFIDVALNFSVGGVLNVEDQLDKSKLLSAPYPNPAQDQASFDYELPPGTASGSLIVYNIIGKRMKVENLQGRSGTHVVHTSQLKPGVYLVFLQAEGRDWVSRKLIVTQ
ncbi:MAG: T9SS type A sorting domain-containing protein [Bacteroidota bacterium]